jgi:acyl-CoA thioesterase I
MMAVGDGVGQGGRPAVGRHGVRGGIFNSIAWVLWAFWAVLSAAGPSVAAEPLRILMLGDSLTAGFGLIKDESLPAQLQVALEPMVPGVRVINAGVSGDTTAGGQARLAWSLAERLDAVIIALGANDGLRGLAPKQTYANLDAIITTAKDARVPVLLAGMRAPPNLGREYGSAFDAIFPQLAAKHGVVFHSFLLEGVAARPELNQDDGIHPNARGVEVIVSNLLPHVRALIAKIDR